jgi:hypothetical protein
VKGLISVSEIREENGGEGGIRMSPRQQPKSLIERALGLVDSELDRERKCSDVLREQAENTVADKSVANSFARESA